MILFQLMLVVILAFVGFVIDFGMAYVRRRQMQTAADAGALAAAQEYGIRTKADAASFEESMLEPVVAGYTTENGAETYEWTLNELQAKIEVIARAVVPTMFLRLIGLDEIPVAARAAALIRPVIKMGNLLPIAFTWPTMRDAEAGVLMEFWAKDSQDEIPSTAGNFGWLDWTGQSPSAPDLAYALAHPEESPYVSVDDMITGSTGVEPAKSVKDALDALILLSMEGRHFYVVGYEVSNDLTGGNYEYQVGGFAGFRITGYDFTGGHKKIMGEFVESTIQAPGGDADDLGLTATYLVD